MKPSTIHKKLSSFAPKFYGEKTSGQIMYWVRQMVKPYNVKVNRVIDKQNVALSAFTVGGFFDPSLEFGEKDIEMFIVFNEREKNDKFFFNEELTKILIDEVFTTLLHEKRHKYQFRKRGNNYGKQYRVRVNDENLKHELQYYGDMDEIDAYAQEAVIEDRLHKECAGSTKQKYCDLFSTFDPKVYQRFLKKYYKFNQKITL